MLRLPLCKIQSQHFNFFDLFCTVSNFVSDFVVKPCLRIMIHNIVKS